MARNIEFKIVAKVATGELDKLQAELGDVLKQINKVGAAGADLFNGDSKAIKGVSKDLKEMGNVLAKSNINSLTNDKSIQNWGKQVKNAIGSASKAFVEGSKDVGAMSTRVKALRGDISKLEAAGNKMTFFSEKEVANAERLTKLSDQLTAARKRLQDIEKRGKINTSEFKDAEKDVRQLAAAYKVAERAMENHQKEGQALALQAINTQNRMRNLTEELKNTKTPVDKQQSAALKKVRDDLEKLGPAYKDAVATMSQVMSKFGAEALETADNNRKFTNGLRDSIDQLLKYSSALKGSQEEQQRIARGIIADVGNTRAALKSASNEYTKQEQHYVQLTSLASRYANASSRLADIDDQTTAAMRRGNKAMEERKILSAQLGALKGDLMSAQKQLIGKDANLEKEMISYKRRIEEARNAFMELGRARNAYSKDTNEFADLSDSMTRKIREIQMLGEAMKENRNNAKAVATGLNEIEVQLTQVGRRLDGLDSKFDSAFDISATIKRITSFAAELAAAFGTKITAAITTAANAMRRIGATADSVFSGLQRAVQGTGNAFAKFGSHVKSNMDKARDSMLAVTAAGYSLMSIGNQVQMFGNTAFRTMGRGMSEYMEYERTRIQAAIAATSFDNETKTMSVDNALIDRIIFDMQSGGGTYTGDNMRFANGQPIPVTFNAKDLAQGMYYYSAAIGLPINESNAAQFIPTLNTIMQMAKVSNTELESAIKGVMNIAMEFGYDPRTAGDQADIQKITAQTGYLANISTMEVTDIVEMFKMVGPMANLVAGGDKGAGLDDTFLLALMASEVGLRGGNVGRGVSQLFTSLVAPTGKMLETMGKYFNEGGEAFTEADYKAEFFEGGALKDYGDDPRQQGILGFFSRLADQDLSGSDMAAMVADMFTNNATRASIGPMLGLDKDKIAGMDWKEFFEGWDENPMKWLAQAAAETANSVSGWFDYMKNSWFQFQAAIVNSTKGSLMGAFKGIGDVLFAVAGAINEFPAIGSAIAAVASFVAAIASIGGTVLIASGAILIFSRTFVAMGGVVGLIVKTVAMAAISFGALIPIFLLLAAAAAGLHVAWKRDFMGMRTAYENFRSNFSMDTDFQEITTNVLRRLALFGRGFSEFMDTIVFGSGTGLRNLSESLNRIFGNTLGQALLSKFIDLRSEINLANTAVGKLFTGFSDRVGRVNLSLLTMQDIIRATQGFMTQLFMPGQMSGESIKAIYAIGDAFGFVGDEFLDFVRNTANNFRQITSIVAAAAIVVYRSWRDAMSGIWDAIGNVLDALSGQDAMGSFASLMEGVAKGMANTFEVVASVIETVLNMFADLVASTQNVSNATITFGTHVIKLADAFEILGTAIGVALGINLLMRFAPLVSVLTHLVPIVATLGAGFLGLAGRLAVAATGFAALILQGIGTAAMLTTQSVAWAIKTGLTLADSAANAANTASSMAAAGGMAALGAATFAAAAAMLSMVSGVLLLVGVLLAIAGTLAVVAGGMLIAVTATQGLSAGFIGLVALIQGIAAGFMMIAGPLFNVISTMYKFVDAITMAIGMGSAFKVMGYAIGITLGLILVAVTGLIIGLGLLAAAWVATWLGATAPILVVMAVIAGIGVALGLAVIGVKAGIDEMEDRFGSLGNAVNLVMANIVEGIRDAMVTVVNTIADGLNWVINKSKETFGDNVVSEALFGGSIGDWEPDWGKDYKKTVLADIEYNKRAPYIERVGLIVDPVVEGGDGGGTIKSILAAIGLDDDAEKIAVKFGIDLDTASVGDIQTIVTEMMKIPEAATAIEGVNLDEILLTKEQAQEQVDNWEEYNKAIDNYVQQGKSRQEAIQQTNEDYIQMGKKIPSVPSAMAQMILGQDEENQAAMEQYKKTMADWEKASQEWFNATPEEMFGTLFDPFAGPDNKSLISWMAGPGFESIMKNVPEGAAPWMNQTEFMADFAIGGGMDFAGEGVYGQNLHKLLKDSGALDTLSAQTGVSVDVLLTGVPKFQAPEEFQSVAMADMTRMIGGLDQHVATWLDTSFGRGVTIASSGITKDFTAAGMDWAELNSFAIGKALQGQDWNLADYVAESWDMSIADAEAYLAANNIDPNILNEGMYALTEQAALSSNGAFNVMSDDMYKWLGEATDGFTSMVIEMTESEFMALDDATKAILTRMGYTFVVNDYVPPEAIDKAKTDVDNLRRGIMDSLGDNEWGTWTNGNPIADLDMDGIIEDWTFISEFIDEKTGETMVVLQDLDGTQVAIPAAEYQAYMDSLDHVTKITGEYMRNLQEEVENNSPTFKPMTDMNMGSVWDTDNYGTGTSQGGPPKTSNASLGVPDKLEVKVEFNVTDVPDADFSAALGIPMTDGAGTINIKMVTEGFSEAGDAASKIKDSLEGLTTGGAPIKIKIEADLNSFGQQLSTYVNSPTTPMKLRVEADLNTLGQQLSTYVNSPTTPMKLKVEADMSDVAGKLGPLMTALSTYATTHTATLQVLNADTTANAIGNNNGLAKVYAATWTAILALLNASDVGNAIQGATDKATAYAVTWTATLAVAGDGQAVGLIGGATGAARIYAVTWTATLAVANSGPAYTAIQTVKNMADSLQGTYTVTLAVNDYANGAVNDLAWSLGQLPTYKSVTIDTFRNEYVSRIGGGGYATVATGGRIGSAGHAGRYGGHDTGSGYVGQYSHIIGRATGGRSQNGELTLVGEQGPELVGLNTGSFVMTARQTEKLFRESQAGEGNPLIIAAARSGDTATGATINNESVVININGDIHIGDEAHAKDFFNEIDRRTGKEFQLARRGMRPTSSYID